MKQTTFQKIVLLLATIGVFYAGNEIRERDLKEGIYLCEVTHENNQDLLEACKNRFYD